MFIETERLVLRTFEKSDSHDMLDYLSQITMPCFEKIKIGSQDEVEKAIEKRMADELYVAIVLKETGQVIGEMFSQGKSMNFVTGEIDTYSPAWLLSDAFQGKGYGYEAVSTYIDYLFCEKKARRLYIYTEDYNIACQKLCQKLGARQEGLFQAFVSFVTDEEDQPIYENIYQYALLATEWSSKER